jgi:hypothetical protein
MTNAASAPPKATPPYLPWKTLDNTITGWKAVVPQRIDRSLLGTYAGTMQGLLLGALKYFHLIDATGTPTDSLRQLVGAEGEQRQKLVGALVRQGYPFLFQDGFDLTKTTPQQLNEKFEAAGVGGETKAKAISFFTAMAKVGGIPLSPFVKTRERRTTSRRAPQKKTKPPVAPPAIVTNFNNHGAQTMKTISLPESGGTITLSGNINLFALAGAERELVFKLIDSMRQFEDATEAGGDE